MCGPVVRPGTDDGTNGRAPSARGHGRRKPDCRGHPWPAIHDQQTCHRPRDDGHASDYDRGALVKASSSPTRHGAAALGRGKKRRRKTSAFTPGSSHSSNSLRETTKRSSSRLRGLRHLNSNGTTVSYPLVGRLAEMSLNPGRQK